MGCIPLNGFDDSMILQVSIASTQSDVCVFVLVVSMCVYLVFSLFICSLPHFLYFRPFVCVVFDSFSFLLLFFLSILIRLIIDVLLLLFVLFFFSVCF